MSSVQDFDRPPQTGSTAPVAPTTPTGNVSPPAAGVVDNRDSISKSQSETDSVIANSSIPVLTPPVFGGLTLSGDSSSGSVGSVSGAAFTQHTMNQIDEIKSSILDGWVKNLQEIAARRERERNSPEYKAMLDRESSQYLAQMALKSPEASINAAINSPEFVRLLNQVTPAEKTALTESTRAYATISGVKDYAVQQGAAASGMLAMMGGIGGVAIDTVISGNAMVTTIENIGGALAMGAETLVQGIAAGVTASYNAMLMMLGGFFSQQILQFSLAETASKASARGEKAGDLETAKTYAKNIISFVSDPGFNSFVRLHVLSKMSGADKLTEAQKDNLTSNLKIMLLGTAVALLTKAETGWINPTELRDLMTGKVELPAGDIRGVLIAAVRAELNYLGPNVKFKGPDGKETDMIEVLGNVFAKRNTDGKRVVDQDMMKVVSTVKGVNEYLDAGRPISAAVGG